MKLQDFSLELLGGFEPPTSCRNMRSNQLSYITFIYIKQMPRFADKRLTDLVLQRYGLTINHSIISLRSPPTSVIPFGMCRLPKHHFTNMSKNSSLLFPVSLQGQAQRPDWVPDNRRFGLTLVRVREYFGCSSKLYPLSFFAIQ